MSLAPLPVCQWMMKSDGPGAKGVFARSPLASTKWLSVIHWFALTSAFVCSHNSLVHVGFPPWMHCQQWTMSQNMGSMDAVFSSSVPRPQVEPLCPSTLIETRRPLPERQVSIPCNFAWEVLRVPFENLHRLYQEIKVFNVWCPEKKKRHWAFLEGDILRGEGCHTAWLLRVAPKQSFPWLPWQPRTFAGADRNWAKKGCGMAGMANKWGQTFFFAGNLWGPQKVCLMLGVIVVHVPFLYQSWWDGQVYSACGFYVISTCTGFVTNLVL